jgi:predicted ArsR family transcriptional regulator
LGLLEDLLVTLAEGGSRTATDLAQKLGTSERMVKELIEGLSQMGYLRSLSSECGGSCGSCPLAGECATGGATGIWALTEEGREAARRWDTKGS